MRYVCDLCLPVELVERRAATNAPAADRQPASGTAALRRQPWPPRLKQVGGCVDGTATAACRFIAHRTAKTPDSIERTAEMIDRTDRFLARQHPRQTVLVTVTCS